MKNLWDSEIMRNFALGEAERYAVYFRNFRDFEISEPIPEQKCSGLSFLWWAWCTLHNHKILSSISLTAATTVFGSSFA